MKKTALLAVAALAFPVAAIAQENAPVATPAPAAAAAPTAVPDVIAPAATKVELKDGSWAQVGADGLVTVSKDGGKSWIPAPDGMWEAKDGSKITTKAGKKA